MKIAIFHNFLDNIGGAEKVVLTLGEDLSADIYSTNIDYAKIAKMGFANLSLKSIGKIPINAPFRQQLALYKFRKLSLGKQYDFYIIAGDWAVSGAVNHHPNLWYVHSPIREIWDLYKVTRNKTVPCLLRPVFDVWVLCNRFLNRRYIKSVDKIVCNSTNTKNRVKKYLKQDALVIHPPIETNKFYYKQNGDYWLSVNRLFSHKRIDIQIKAFQQLPNEKLIIVGSYEKSRHFQQYANYIKKIKPDNVEILSWVDDQKLIDLYANCKAFITTAQDEDFGMTVLEAMAAGKAVIAPNEGGYRETVIDNVTGKLIDDIDSDKLIKAIKEIDQQPEHYKEACLEQAKKFDRQVFIEKIKKEIINARK